MNLSTSGQLLLTIAAAMAGGYLALRLRIPAGALTGSMIAAAALNILFNTAYVPPGWKFYTQIATGAYIGAKISREDAAQRAASSSAWDKTRKDENDRGGPAARPAGNKPMIFSIFTLTDQGKPRMI